MKPALYRHKERTTSEETAQGIRFWLKYIAILLTLAVCLYAFDVFRGEQLRRNYTEAMRAVNSYWMNHPLPGSDSAK